MITKLQNNFKDILSFKRSIRYKIERNKNKTHLAVDFGVGSQVLECRNRKFHSNAINIVHVMHTC